MEATSFHKEPENKADDESKPPDSNYIIPVVTGDTSAIDDLADNNFAQENILVEFKFETGLDDFELPEDPAVDLFGYPVGDPFNLLDFPQNAFSSVHGLFSADSILPPVNHLLPQALPGVVPASVPTTSGTTAASLSSNKENKGKLKKDSLIDQLLLNEPQASPPTSPGTSATSKSSKEKSKEKRKKAGVKEGKITKKKKSKKSRKIQNTEGAENGNQPKKRGPQKGTGGRPTLEAEFEKLRIKVEALKLKKASETNNPPQPKVNVEATVDAEPPKWPQDTMTAVKEEAECPEDTELMDVSVVKKENEDEFDVDEAEKEDPLATNVLFLNNDPEKVQLLVTCDKFTKENKMEMDEFFQLRFPQDRIGKSKFKTLFIVKSVVKEFRTKAIKMIKKNKFKGSNVRVTVYENRGCFMLPTVSVYTDKNKTKK